MIPIPGSGNSIRYRYEFTPEKPVLKGDTTLTASFPPLGIGSWMWTKSVVTVQPRGTRPCTMLRRSTSVDRYGPPLAVCVCACVCVFDIISDVCLCVCCSTTCAWTTVTPTWPWPSTSCATTTAHHGTWSTCAWGLLFMGSM